MIDHRQEIQESLQVELYCRDQKKTRISEKFGLLQTQKALIHKERVCKKKTKGERLGCKLGVCHRERSARIETRITQEKEDCYLPAVFATVLLTILCNFVINLRGRRKL